jgi:hypothetical protein
MAYALPVDDRIGFAQFVMLAGFAGLHDCTNISPRLTSFLVKR